MPLSRVNACLKVKHPLAGSRRSSLQPHPISTCQLVGSVAPASGRSHQHAGLAQQLGCWQRHILVSTACKHQNSLQPSSASLRLRAEASSISWPSSHGCDWPPRYSSSAIAAALSPKRNPRCFGGKQCKQHHTVSAAASRPQASDSQHSDVSSSHQRVDRGHGNDHGPGGNGGGSTGTRRTASAGSDPSWNSVWARAAILVLKVLAGLAVSLLLIAAAAPSVVSTGPGLAVTLSLINLFLHGSIHADEVLTFRALMMLLLLCCTLDCMDCRVGAYGEGGWKLKAMCIPWMRK